MKWQTLDKVLLSLISDQDSACLAEQFDQHPVLRGNGMQERLVLADIRRYRKLWQMIVSREAYLKPEFEPIKAIGRHLSKYEKKLHRQLSNGQLMAQGVKRGKSSTAKKIATGLWQNMSLDFNRGAAEEEGRIVFKGIRIKKAFKKAAPEKVSQSPSTLPKRRGRPSDRNLYIDEFKRWCAGSDIVKKNLVRNAENLHKWYTATHPNATHTKISVIANNIRALHKSYWRSQEKNPRKS